MILEPSSPRTRRYFLPLTLLLSAVSLFSAHAEVFPIPPSVARGLSTLLRARGGISKDVRDGPMVDDSSPRTRRYFPFWCSQSPSTSLFSAHAEVFPSSATASPSAARSSPRTRRYFRRVTASTRSAVLFSAHAEVFPLGAGRRAPSVSLLRARGGISGPSCGGFFMRSSSPRTRRYFPVRSLGGLDGGLFSAHAEVFPWRGPVVVIATALLRARGGISSGDRAHMSHQRSSPRTRRYFRVLRPAERDVRALLRARGGISVRHAQKPRSGPSSPRTRRYFPGSSTTRK